MPSLDRPARDVQNVGMAGQYDHLDLLGQVGPDLQLGASARVVGGTKDIVEDQRRRLAAAGEL